MHQAIPNPYRECKKLIFCLDQGFKEDFPSTLSAFAFIFKICDQANFSRTLTPKHDQKKSNFYQGSNKLMKQKYQINQCASPVSTYFCAHLQNKNVGLVWPGLVCVFFHSYLSSILSASKMPMFSESRMDALRNNKQRCDQLRLVYLTD